MKTKYFLKDQYVKLSPDLRLHQVKVPIIGITGGIACGKSLFRELLNRHNLPTLCADTIVKEIYLLPTTLDFIKKKFPEIEFEGQIFFPQLRARVFNNPRELKELENFIFPQIPKIISDKIQKMELTNFIFYDIPLMFEMKLESKFDLTLCISTTRERQIERVQKRDSIDRELAIKIIEKQMDLKLKEQKADLVFMNNGSTQDLSLAVDRFILDHFTSN
jgi:dephospho-CoA kinase